MQCAQRLRCVSNFLCLFSILFYFPQPVLFVFLSFSSLTFALFLNDYSTDLKYFSLLLQLLD